MQKVILHEINFDKNEIQKIAIELNSGLITGILSFPIEISPGWMGLNLHGTRQCTKIHYQGREIVIFEEFSWVARILGILSIAEMYITGIIESTEYLLLTSKENTPVEISTSISEASGVL